MAGRRPALSVDSLTFPPRNGSRHNRTAPVVRPPARSGRRDGNNNSDGSTSLKWGSDGELSPVDLQRVLERLTNPDLTRCALEEQG